MQKKNRKCYQISHTQKQARPQAAWIDGRWHQEWLEGTPATMGPATATKKKIIPHISHTPPRNTRGSEVAALNSHWLQSAHIQSAQRLASRSIGSEPSNVRKRWFCPCGRAVAKSQALLLRGRPMNTRKLLGNIAVTCFILVQLADWLATYQGLIRFGTEIEGNPLLRFLMERYDIVLPSLPPRSPPRSLVPFFIFSTATWKWPA